MSIDLVRNFYRDILKKILKIELQKKKIAHQILLLRTEQERLPLIRDFLHQDLAKHQLLEQAMVSATQNKTDEVLSHIRALYGLTEGHPLPDYIRKEISFNQQLLDQVNKEIKHPESCAFFERRMVKEANKYVVSQAREYAKMNF